MEKKGKQSKGDGEEDVVACKSKGVKSILSNFSMLGLVHIVAEFVVIIGVVMWMSRRLGDTNRKLAEQEAVIVKMSTAFTEMAKEIERLKQQNALLSRQIEHLAQAVQFAPPQQHHQRPLPMQHSEQPARSRPSASSLLDEPVRTVRQQEAFAPPPAKADLQEEDDEDEIVEQEIRAIEANRVRSSARASKAPVPDAYVCSGDVCELETLMNRSFEKKPGQRSAH